MPQPTTTGGGLMGYPSSVDTGQVTPLIISNEAAVELGTSTVLVANTVYLFGFELLAPVTITKARWRMSATVTGTTNIGVYTFAGNLITGSDTGAVTNVASVENAFTYATPLSLSPGQYFLAIAPSNSTDTYQIKTAGGGTQGGSRCRTATNTLAANALPLTTGTLVVTNLYVSCNLLISGGLT